MLCALSPFETSNAWAHWSPYCAMNAFYRIHINQASCHAAGCKKQCYWKRQWLVQQKPVGIFAIPHQNIKTPVKVQAH